MPRASIEARASARLGRRRAALSSRSESGAHTAVEVEPGEEVIVVVEPKTQDAEHRVAVQDHFGDE